MRQGFRALYQALKEVPVHTCLIGHPQLDENSGKFQLAIPGGSREKIVALGCNLLCYVAKNTRKPGQSGAWPGTQFYFADYGAYPAGAQLGAFLPGRVEADLVKVIGTLRKRYDDSRKRAIKLKKQKR